LRFCCLFQANRRLMVISISKPKFDTLFNLDNVLFKIPYRRVLRKV
jgi:hypothetical protein